jgi:DNA-binding MarR family transcriptional regulator
MERDGLIERRRSPSDGRSVTVHLTERARQLEPLLKEAAARVNAQVTRSLSDRQVLTFMRTLTEIVGEAEQLVLPR